MKTRAKLAMGLASIAFAVAQPAAYADLLVLTGFAETMAVATASSAFNDPIQFPDSGQPKNTINGSGFDLATGACGNGDWAEAWMGANRGATTGLNEWLKIDLGASYSLASMTVYNSNDAAWNDYMYRGIKQGDIYVSNSATDPGNPVDNPGNWTSKSDNYSFTMASGRTDYGTNTSYNMPDTFDLTGTQARYVAIKVDSIFGTDAWGNNIASISEVVVSAIPEPASLSLLGILGGTLLLRRKIRG